MEWLEKNWRILIVICFLLGVLTNVVLKTVDTIIILKFGEMIEEEKKNLTHILILYGKVARLDGRIKEIKR